MKKQNTKWFIIAIIIIVIAIIAYYVIFKKANIKIESKTTLDVNSKKQTPAPTPSKSLFPLKRGSSGELVTLLQKFLNLNIKPPFTAITEDGIFGEDTEKALLRITYKNEVTKEDLDKFSQNLNAKTWVPFYPAV
ncbi:MAG: peptidoglycan-binding domain-containing protein [Bacteroidales bacterium]